MNNKYNNLKKFNDIMQKYKQGYFGKNHLTLEQILKSAGEENLINEMSIREVQQLLDSSSGMTKIMFSKIIEQNKKKTKSLTKKLRHRRK